MSPTAEKSIYQSIFRTRIRFDEQGGDAKGTKDGRSSLESVGEDS